MTNFILRRMRIYFYYLNTDAFKTVMPLLAENQYNITKYREDAFTGTITVTEDKPLVFTSIPYDEGWNIYANGEKFNLQRCWTG